MHSTTNALIQYCGHTITLKSFWLITEMRVSDQSKCTKTTMLQKIELTIATCPWLQQATITYRAAGIMTDLVVSER